MVLSLLLGNVHDDDDDDDVDDDDDDNDDDDDDDDADDDVDDDDDDDDDLHLNFIPEIQNQLHFTSQSCRGLRWAQKVGLLLAYKVQHQLYFKYSYVTLTKIFLYLIGTA